jgi:hypothetical protein
MTSRTASTLLTRRSWLQGSALLALYACATGGARALTPRFRSIAANAVVIDAGLPEAAALADSWDAGVRLEMLHDDVAELFYERLAPAWRGSGVRGLAGLTRAAGLFLLEPLAADYGLRTVGVRRAPAAGRTVLESVCRRSDTPPRPVGVGAYREALLAGDDTAFAWWMAPVRRPRHAGVTVIPA